MCIYIYIEGFLGVLRIGIKGLRAECCVGRLLLNSSRAADFQSLGFGIWGLGVLEGLGLRVRPRFELLRNFLSRKII